MLGTAARTPKSSRRTIAAACRRTNAISDSADQHLRSLARGVAAIPPVGEGSDVALVPTTGSTFRDEVLIQAILSQDNDWVWVGEGDVVVAMVVVAMVVVVVGGGRGGGEGGSNERGRRARRTFATKIISNSVSTGALLIEIGILHILSFVLSETNHEQATLVPRHCGLPQGISLIWKDSVHTLDIVFGPGLFF